MITSRCSEPLKRSDTVDGNGQMLPSLYLIDAWVSVSDAYHERLSLLNQISEPWVSVLIPVEQSGRRDER